MNKKLVLRFGALLVVSLLLITNLFVWSRLVLASNRNLIVKVYNIGQGDSIFIRTPDNYKILIDGGPNNKVVDYLNKELGLNDRELDLLVLTHPQADHMYGLIETIKKFNVKKLITSDVKNNTSMYKLWIDTLNNSHLKPQFVFAGESITLSDQVKMQIVWPVEAKPRSTDLNDACVVIKLTYGNFDMLLTGDADQRVQPYSGNLSHIEVLKVPHHGSKTALNEQFLQELAPDQSVISVGQRNQYGHPAEVLLKLLNSNSNKVFRTDQNGTVTFVSDGRKWYTQLEKQD